MELKERFALASVKLYEKRKLEKRCLLCGRQRNKKGNYCKLCFKKGQKRRKLLISKNLCSNCGKRQLKSKTRCRICINRTRQYRWKIKNEVINAYGGKCFCCNCEIMEFLTIEHTRNDGQYQKKKIKLFGSEFYKWLKKQNFPKNLGLAILCMNCNFSKGKYGYCPHKRKS